MSNPETHTCPDCGYTWKHGHDGSHSCVTYLKAALKDRDCKHFTIVGKHINKINDSIKVLLLGQAEMEAYSWDELDNLKYAVGERKKMKAIRNGTK